MSEASKLKTVVSSPRFKKLAPYVGIALIIIAAILVAYIMIVTPQKAPYRSALAQYKNVYNANIAFTQAGAALGASSATDDQFVSNINSARNALKSLQTETEVLGQKAVLTSGEGRALYDAFQAKLKAYASYNNTILDSIQKVRPTVYECSQSSKNITESAASAAVIKTCAQNLGKIKNVPDADYRQMVASFKDIYTKLAANIAATAALKDRTGADKDRYDALGAERNTILTDLNATASTLTKNLQAHRDEVDITETAMALDDYLSKNARLFW